MRNKALGLGIIGCGNVLAEYMSVAAPLVRAGRLRPVVACDANPDKQAHVRDAFGVARFTADADEVLRADDVDVVLILTPMREHAALACAALAAGKHALVEKTMGTTREEAARVLAAARGSRAWLLCAPHVLLSPTFQAMARRVRAGDIGTVATARARYGWADPYWQGGWVYRRGAGVLAEYAVYNVTTLTGLLGPVRAVTAMAGIAVPERTLGGERVTVEAEDNAQIALTFASGALAVVTASFTMQRYRSPAIELYGTTGTLQMLGDDWAPAGHELWQNAAGCWTEMDETDPRWSWADGLRHLVECVETGRRPLTTPEHAFHVFDVLLAARAAAESGRRQEVASTFPAVELAEAAP